MYHQASGNFEQLGVEREAHEEALLLVAQKTWKVSRLGSPKIYN